MFDGTINTLEEVINHYGSGGKTHQNKSPLLTGFKLSQQEKIALIKFLETLTEE